MKDNSLIKEILEIRKNLPKGFCPVPFTTIILEPDGKVGLCRNKGNNFPVGQLSFNNIDEIWDIRNSEKASRWRNEFLTGENIICKEEVTHRKCHLDYHFNDLLPQAELEAIQKGKILRLTANLNGRCNMQCPFCTVWTQPNGFYTEENFWVPARTSLFPYLKQIDMLAGEPFIQSDTYKLIDEVSAVNPDCSWIFTTNMYWNLNEKISEKLDKIRIKNISVSIDSFKDDVYSRLRFPGKLSVTMKNLEVLFQYRQKRISQGRNFTLSLNFLVQKENWTELPELFRFAERNNMEFVGILLTNPLSHSILDLADEDRLNILNFYLQELSDLDVFKINPIIMPLLETLGKIEKIRYLDILSHRGQRP